MYGTPENGARQEKLDWLIRVISGRFALHQTYSTFLFLGEPPESGSEYHVAPNLLGYSTVFIGADTSQCENCITQADNLDEGFVYITKKLEDRGHLLKSEEEIEQYLRDNLEWRIQKVNP